MPTYSPHSSHLVTVVRDIVGRYYDQNQGGPPERFNEKRALTVVGIPSSYEFAGHIAISLSGTPPRGLVTLLVANCPHAAIDCIAGRRISPVEVVQLLQFVEAASGCMADRIPRDFYWSSSDDSTSTQPGSCEAPQVS